MASNGGESAPAAESSSSTDPVIRPGGELAPAAESSSSTDLVTRPGGESAPAAESSSSTDLVPTVENDDESESHQDAQQDERDREELLRQGRENAEIRRLKTTQFGPGISAVKMCMRPVLKNVRDHYWSANGNRRKVEESLKKANSQIEALARVNNRPELKNCLLANSALTGFCQATAQLLDGFRSASDDGAKAENAEKLAQHMDVSVAGFERQSFSCKLIIPLDRRVQIQEALEFNNTRPELSLLAPLPSQKELVEKKEAQIATMLEKLSLEERPDINEIRDAIRKTVEKIEEANQLIGLNKQDHATPRELLDVIAKIGQKEQQTREQSIIRNLYDFKSYCQVGGYSQNFLDGGVLGKILVDPGDAQVREARSVLLDCTKDADTTEPDFNALIAFLDQENLNNIGQRSDPASTSALPLFDDSDLIVLPPDMQFGTIVAWKSLGPNRNRIIVNQGTENRPHYIIIPGYALGGTLDTNSLMDRKIPNYSNEDIKEMKKQMPKGVRINHAVQVGVTTAPEFQERSSNMRALPSTNDTKKTVTKSREPPTYFLAEFLDLSWTIHLRRWLTWSQIKILIGNPNAGKYIKKCRDRWNTNERALQQARIMGIHPDTNAPLTIEDKNNNPWLAIEPAPRIGMITGPAEDRDTAMPDASE